MKRAMLILVAVLGILAVAFADATAPIDRVHQSWKARQGRAKSLRVKLKVEHYHPQDSITKSYRANLRPGAAVPSKNSPELRFTTHCELEIRSDGFR
jgi:hypothetical protein